MCFHLNFPPLTGFASIPVIIIIMILHVLLLIIAVIHMYLWSWTAPSPLTAWCSLPILIGWSRFASFLGNLHIMHHSMILQFISRRNTCFPCSSSNNRRYICRYSPAWLSNIICIAKESSTCSISFWSDWSIQWLLLLIICILLCFLILRYTLLLILRYRGCVRSITEWKCCIWTVRTCQSILMMTMILFLFACCIIVFFILAKIFLFLWSVVMILLFLLCWSCWN